MIRVLIADDEPLHRRGMRELIEKMRPDWHVETARNGRELLQIAQEHSPEVVFSDIRMPYFDGFQVIDKLKVNHKAIIIVFVSAFADFEYAQKAIDKGAFSYLLKPIDKKQLVLLLERIENVLQAQHQYRVNAENDTSHLQSALALYTNHYINRWIQGYPLDTIEELTEDARTVVSHTGSGFIVLFRLCWEENDHTYSAQDIEEISINCAYWLRQAHPNGYCCFIEGEQATVALILTSFPEDLQEQCQVFCKTASKEYACNCIAGIGRQVENLSAQIKQAYSTAKNALALYFYCPDTTVFWDRDSFGQMESTDSAFDHLDRKRFGEAIQKGSTAEAMEIINKTVEHMKAVKVSPDLLKDQIRLLILWTVNNLIPPPPHNAIHALLYKMNHITNSIALPRYLDILQETVEEMTALYSIQPQADFSECVRYVQNNYARDLHLGDVAHKFHYSSSHFSMLFRQYTCETFVTFLNRIRMEQACILLESSNQKIYEIAQSVGIPNDKYFHRLFKKHTGLSAQEYRKNRKSPESRSLH